MIYVLLIYFLVLHSYVYLLNWLFKMMFWSAITKRCYKGKKMFFFSYSIEASRASVSVCRVDVKRGKWKSFGDVGGAAANAVSYHSWSSALSDLRHVSVSSRCRKMSGYFPCTSSVCLLSYSVTNLRRGSLTDLHLLNWHTSPVCSKGWVCVYRSDTRVIFSSWNLVGGLSGFYPADWLELPWLNLRRRLFCNSNVIQI